MQNVGQNENPDSTNDAKAVEVSQANVTPSSGPLVMEKTHLIAAIQQQCFDDLSASEDEEVSEVR